MTEFSYRVCINLDRRPERWERVQREFARHGINEVHRVAAVDGAVVDVPASWPYPRGAYGCLLSHLQVVRKAREMRVPNVLIFEDDVVLDARFQEKVAACMAELPSDWDMVFLGALHRDDPIPVSERIGQVTRAHMTYAYALNQKVFDAFIDSNSRAIFAVDENNLKLQAEFKCYCFLPNVAWVESLYSDAQERMSNHWYLRESLVMHGRDINALIPHTLLAIAYGNPFHNKKAADNLLYLLRVNHRRLPKMAITVVEQGPQATIDPAELPESVQYIQLLGNGLLNRGACYNAAVRASDPGKTILSFIDSDVFMEEFDIRGNLAMCERFDATTGFERSIQLSARDTRQLKNDDSISMRWLEPREYVWQKKVDSFDRCSFFNRRAFLEMGGWSDEPQGPLALRKTANAKWPLRIFDSPSYAFCLHQGD